MGQARQAFLLSLGLALSAGCGGTSGSEGQSDGTVQETLASGFGTLVGAIRWDGWTGGMSYPFCTYPGGTVPPSNWSPTNPCYEGWNNSMFLMNYPDRLPFYSYRWTGPGADGRYLPFEVIREDRRDLEIIDAQLTYAKNAGIDYFAYVWYPEFYPTFVQPLALPRLLHAASAHRTDVKMALVGWESNAWGRGGPTRTCDLFRKPFYQKVSVGGILRPLVYVFPVTAYTAADVQDLRSACSALGVHWPYVVGMDWDSTMTASEAKSRLFDAVSEYTTFAATSGESHATLSERGENLWVSHRRAASAQGLGMVPWVATGWDPRPRFGASQPYAVKATPDEVASDVFDAANFARSDSDAKTMIIYAWNENSEGGWLVPLLTDRGPDTSRLDAIRSLKSRTIPNLGRTATWTASSTMHWMGEDFTAGRAGDGNYATAWQSDTWNDSWLQMSFSIPQTFNKIVLSEYDRRIQTYQLLVSNDGAHWTLIHSGSRVDARRYVNVARTTAKHLRLHISSAYYTPIIYEFEAYNL